VLTAGAALAALALTVGLSALLAGHGPGGGQVTDRFATTYFEAYGIVPVAYAVFGVALGALVGTVVRRTLAAVGATLALFVGVRLLVSLLRVEVLDRPAESWYWPAQLAESALFLALAATAAAVTARLVARLG
jgi:putative Mn2+ efflux pump MntP